jgi:hypothetical protein
VTAATAGWVLAGAYVAWQIVAEWRKTRKLRAALRAEEQRCPS